MCIRDRYNEGGVTPPFLNGQINGVMCDVVFHKAVEYVEINGVICLDYCSDL